MPRVYTRNRSSVRGEWSEENLIKAAKAVEDRVMGVNEAAKFYGIPKTTFKRRLQHRNFEKDGMGPPSSLGKENEAKIALHIKKLQAKGFTPCRDSVRSMAYELAEKLKLPHKFNKETKKAGYDWLQSFMDRNPTLSIRKAEGVSLARVKGMNKKDVDNFYNLLEKVLEDNALFEKPGSIFNMDETGLQLNNKPSDVVAIKGSKNVTTITSGEKGETISVLTCCNGEGAFLPPYCVFKGKNKKLEYGDGMPPGSEIAMSPKSAYVNSEIFFDWLKSHFYPRKPEGKVLLLLDGHTSHTSSVEMLEFAEEKDIVLMSFPPHTTHWLQPLDRSFFKSLKSNFNVSTNHFMRTHPSRKITRLQFGTLLSSSWSKSANVDNGVNGFRAAGIIPLDRIPSYSYLTEESANHISDTTNQEIEAEIQNDEYNNTTEVVESEHIVTPSTSQNSINLEITPSKMLDDIHAVPTIQVEKLKRKLSTVATVLNSPENIASKKKKIAEKALQEAKKAERQEKKKLNTQKGKKENKSAIKQNSPSTSEEKAMKGPKKGKRNDKRDLDTQMEMKKKKRPKKQHSPATSSDSEHEDIVYAEEDDTFDDYRNESECVGCGETYSETTISDDWVKCTGCTCWFHESCSRFESRCENCEKRKTSNLTKNM